MKFSDPRYTLVAGLALALGLYAASPTRAAESKKVRLQIAKSAPNQTFAQVPPAPVPDLSDTPSTPDLSAPATPQGALTPVPQPQPNPSSSTIAPAPLGTQPSPTPAPRPPMGLFYGEQDKLDQLQSPNSLAPRPLPSSTGTPVPPQFPAATVEGAVDRFGFAPPPGTLGQTYKRRSRLIDDKKHPRIGMVDVNLPEEVDVTAIGLKTKWTGKVWRLESDPLLPGVPHIYEIKAQWGEGTEPQYRTVRLIMGRIVDLDF